MSYSIRIQNFASFNDSGPFELREGLNVFTGINNAGKTALLWSLATLGADLEPQRRWQMTLQSILAGYMQRDVLPCITVEFPLAPNYRNAVLGNICRLAGNPEYPPFADSNETFRFTWVIDANRRIGFRGEVIVSRLHNGNREETNIFHYDEKSRKYALLHPFGAAPPNTWQPPQFDIQMLGTSDPDKKLFRFAKGDDILAKCWPSILSTVVLLEAHRTLQPGRSNRRSVELDTDAGNLAEVLATAQHTTADLPDGQERFRRIVEEMRRIFPEIRRIRTQVPYEPPGQEGNRPPEIFLDLAHDRSVPLTHSGTGVQQILCLLTGAILQPRPTIFLIDEPHSNLHPAAERSLLRILEAFGRESQHIFCVTTQSALTTSHARRRLMAVTYHENEGSTIKPLSTVEDICSLLGIANMDLFTYDRVLFVEGPSDVAVLQQIFQLFDTTGIYDRTKIVEIFGDGKLKKPKMALGLIRLIVNASTSQIRVPVGLLLDSSDWDEEERQELKKILNVEGRSSVAFLEKPELEDYLIHKAAIAHILGRDAAALQQESQPTPDEVAKVLAESVSIKKGSDRLKDCFAKLIVGREFSKRHDCPRLAGAILTLGPDHLRPLYLEATRFIESIGINGV
ncbi:MAG: AAA family ATPase [Acidobacteriia bacterium]|nr:AAA family ATPase [Terriglobia bacterium]